MRDRNYLLVKATLRIAASAALCIPLYFLISNKTVAFSIMIVLALSSAFMILQQTIRDFRSQQIEVIYNGFRIKNKIITVVITALISVLVANSVVYIFSFYGICVLLYMVERSFDLIIFNFGKREVIGLFDNERRSADDLQIDKINESDPTQIKVTDRSGFFVLERSSYKENRWSRILKNLQRIKQPNGSYSN